MSGTCCPARPTLAGLGLFVGREALGRAGLAWQERFLFPSKAMDAAQGAEKLWESKDSVKLDSQVRKQLENEEDEVKPAWMRYSVKTSTSTSTTSAAGEGPTAVERPSLNPFAPSAKEKETRKTQKRSRIDQLLHDSDPYSSSSSSGKRVRARINVEETAALLSFMK